MFGDYTEEMVGVAHVDVQAAAAALAATEAKTSTQPEKSTKQGLKNKSAADNASMKNGSSVGPSFMKFFHANSAQLEKSYNRSSEPSLHRHAAKA